VVLALVVIGVLVVLVTRARPVLAAWRAHRLVPAGQVVLAVVALLALPGFTSAVATIIGRS
jgi:hypothetical protein